MDLGTKLAKNAREFPDKTAIVFKDRKLTYAELNERATRFGNGVRSLGLAPRDRVAVILRNRSEYLEVIYGLVKAAITVVPVNWRFAPEEMRYVIDHSEAAAVVVADEFFDKLASVMNDLRRVETNRIIYLDAKPPAGLRSYETFLADASSAEIGIENGPKDPFYFGYTSGTTGFPKGAINPHGDWETRMMGLFGLFRLDENDIQLLTMPLFHSNAIATSSGSHYAGQTTVIMERFDPEEALRLMGRYKTTYSSMVPTMFNRIMNLPPELFEKYDVSSMQCFIQSSAPIPFPTKQWVIENFKNAGLHEFYGGTEVGVVTYLAPEEQLERPGSIGRALPVVEIKLLDEQGREVAQGEVGQLVSRPLGGADLGRAGEYYKDEESTKKYFRDGWFCSGDMARVDEDGFYYLVDRKFDMIISGGENIYPAEIETVLHRHEKIMEAAVIGVPDDDWGEAVKAVLVLKEGKAATADEIIRYCREHLAGYKIPRSVDFVDELPKTDTGKILKKIIKAPYWKDREVKI
ncbi:MAG: class I adenylate-forming enzyme family protein [Thermodesulfobacteriota bacterium]